MWFNHRNDFLLCQDAGLFVYFPFDAFLGGEIADEIPPMASLPAHILAAIAKPLGGPSVNAPWRHKKWFYPLNSLQILSRNFSAGKPFLQGVNQQQQSHFNSSN